MASKSFVRVSKFRHVFAGQPKKEEAWQDVKATQSSSWHSNWIDASAKYFAVVMAGTGGGRYMVFKLDKPTKVNPSQHGIIDAHSQAVSDIKFHPHNDDLIASSGEDCVISIVDVPDMGDELTLSKELASKTKPVQHLKGHKRKVGPISFNPTANNILASGSGDMTVKVWDIEKAKDHITLQGFGDVPGHVEFSHDGSLLSTTCKDGVIRIFDPRAGKCVADNSADTFTPFKKVNSTRTNFLGNNTHILAAGLSGKGGGRHFSIYDLRKGGEDYTMSQAFKLQTDQQAAGAIYSFFDPDTKMVYLQGKGDGNLRYYEVDLGEKSECFFLSEFKSNISCKGMCFIPKRAVNVNENEISRALKITSNGTVEPLSFKVPRRSEMFQDDLFPPCFNGEPSVSAEEWLGGKSGEPLTASMEGGFQVKEKKQQVFEEVKEKELTADEMKEKIKKLEDRVAFLEAEIVKKDAEIKSLK